MHHQKRRLTTTFNHPQKSIRMYHSHACVCLMSHASFNIRSVRLHSDAEGVDWTAEISATKLVQGRKRVAVDKFRAKERESVGGSVSRVLLMREHGTTDEAIQLWLKITLSKTKGWKTLPIRRRFSPWTNTTNRQFIGWKVIFLCLPGVPLFRLVPKLFIFLLRTFFILEDLSYLSSHPRQHTAVCASVL